MRGIFILDKELYQICLFEFIRVEGGVKYMKHFKGGGRKL
jgi:hypothetical protein